MILNEEIKKNILKKFQNRKIAVLYGGISEEREVSLRSGENVYKALTSFEEIKDNCILIDVKNHYELVEILKKEKVEYCYNILHGSFGEDGSIQGLFNHFLPFSCSSLGIIIDTDIMFVSKFRSNDLMSGYTIPVNFICMFLNEVFR